MRLPRLLAAVLPLVSVLCACVPARAAAPSHVPAAAPADTARLRRALDDAMRGYGGVAGVSVLNLNSGERVSIRGGEKYPSASLIKVAVLVALLDQVNRGSIGLNE